MNDRRFHPSSRERVPIARNASQVWTDEDYASPTFEFGFGAAATEGGANEVVDPLDLGGRNHRELLRVGRLGHLGFGHTRAMAAPSPLCLVHSTMEKPDRGWARPALVHTTVQNDRAALVQ